jgi:hypothetical protein
MLALGVWERNRLLRSFPWRWGSGGRVLTSGGCAFLRLERIDHVFLLLASTRTLRLKCLTIYIMMWLVNERAFLAVFDTGLRFSGTIAVCRMEETRKAAFRTADFRGSCERVSFEVNIAVFVYCSLRLDFLEFCAFSGWTW